MSKRALVVGIDDYDGALLQGCVNDATAIATCLEADGDGTPNFGVRLLTSNTTKITRKVLKQEIVDLFAEDAEMVLFYFAGHGNIDPETNTGYIASQDGDGAAPGFALPDLLELANKAYPRIKSTVIILDSCNSGALGEITGAAAGGKFSVIGNGVTILTATHRKGAAEEKDGQGVFTDLLIDGLRGSASDVCGRITPAALYSHVDQTLGDWAKRPVYKANVQTFVILRRVAPKVALEVLRRLPEYFPDPTATYELGPSCEPERGEETERLKEIGVDPDKVRIYRELQACNRHGLVVPETYDHMWHAAIYGTGCRLTATGAHYRRLAVMKRIK
ncbi:caspase family protein [Rhizobium laguerreae]|uniref:caspase family protein n=1 Tax=Rhizobium laguerreae TaxID=1076926 RepID=UPI001C923271|nr:caspase family protein [Rhizobium laguerreae]MBY3383212.1 caspase family protein [Rhizobium laguerreae]